MTVEFTLRSSNFRTTTTRFVRVALPWIGMLALLVAASSLLGNHLSTSRQTPDELIPVGVIQHMRADSSLDTDWAHVSTFPDYFKRVHFNFSGYILAGAAFTGITHTPSDYGSLLNCLRQFSKLCTLALLLLVFAVARRLWGAGYALLAAFATMTAPLLFQDAHYARPEAFGTLLFTCVFALALFRDDDGKYDIPKLVLIAIVCGFLVSIKVTYVAAAVFGLPIFWDCVFNRANRRINWKKTAALGLLAGMLFVAGFALGAPDALRHPEAFLDGIHALAYQYSHGSPPDSRPDYRFLSELGWIGGYFAATLGWIALLLHPVGYFKRGCNSCQRAALLAYSVIIIATVLFFAHEHVFFERNFSHLLPGFLIISVGGLKLIVETLGNATPAAKMPIRIAAITIIFVLWQLVPMQVSRDLHRTFSHHYVQKDERHFTRTLAKISRNIGATRVESVDFAQVFREKYPASSGQTCVLYNVTTYGDPWSRKFIADLPHSFRIARKVTSLFSGIPTSTLQVYQSATYYLIYDKASCHP